MIGDLNGFKSIETMFSSGTKISVYVLDLNVIKITTTRRHVNQNTYQE